MYEHSFKINGFHCESCVKLASMKIKKIEGVENFDIKENGDSFIVASREISLDEISQAVESAGHTVAKVDVKKID